MEFLDSYALPFDFRKTAKVIWTPEKDQPSSNLYYLQVSFYSICIVYLDMILALTMVCGCLQNFTAGSNTHMTSFCFAFSMLGVDFRVVIRHVTRRYVEKDRVVFISRALIEPIYEAGSITLVETSRMVLKRGDLSALGPTTVMQTHREAKACGVISGFDTQNLPSIHTVGLENWEKNITRFNNDVEDQLIRTAS